MQGSLRESLLLYAVSDRSWLAGRELQEDVEQALSGGATMLQLREKSYTDSTLLQEARQLVSICQRHRVPLIINDNVALAAQIGADGVHVGQSDMDVAQVRQILGEQALVGVSVQTVSQALDACARGASYLGVGAVFSTTTKHDAQLVELETLAAICAVADVPVVAIGGITLSNIAKLAGSGIAGVAVISEIFAAENIMQRCQDLRREAASHFAPHCFREGR